MYPALEYALPAVISQLDTVDILAVVLGQPRQQCLLFNLLYHIVIVAIFTKQKSTIN